MIHLHFFNHNYQLNKRPYLSVYRIRELFYYHSAKEKNGAIVILLVK